jgi:antibiotic biosynthesis monooxygenase (ABM) superfamily enzyme
VRAAVQSTLLAGVDTTGDVITRLWRGWTTPENADAYEQFLLTRMFPSMRAITGFRGADVLRRPDGQEIAFVTLTRFESIDAIRGFAGDDHEVAVLEPEAIALLSRYEDRASHFVTASFLV